MEEDTFSSMMRENDGHGTLVRTHTWNGYIFNFEIF